MPTLRDVARAAGVSVGTASQAMRGYGVVAKTTKEKVLKVAHEIGYQPNAAAAALVSQRREKRGHKLSLKLAFLQLTEIQRISTIPGFITGCEELGYTYEVFPMWEHQENSAAISRQLWSKGIDGIVWMPTGKSQKTAWWHQFDWSLFPVVQINQALPEPRFHSVRTSFFDDTYLTLKEVFKSGYRRVLFLNWQTHAPNDDHRRLGALEAYRSYDLPPDGQIQHFAIKEAHFEEATTLITKTIRDWKADAVVGFPWSYFYWLGDEGFEIPKEVAFASPQAPSNLEQAPVSIAGCCNQFEELARRAVHSLHRLILLGERGIPEQPDQTVLPSFWQDGESLPKKLKESKGLTAGKSQS